MPWKMSASTRLHLGVPNRPVQRDNLQCLRTEATKLFTGQQTHGMDNADLHKSRRASRVIESTGNIVVPILNQQQPLLLIPPGQDIAGIGIDDIVWPTACRKHVRQIIIDVPTIVATQQRNLEPR